MDSRELSPDDLDELRRLTRRRVTAQTYRGFDGCLVVQVPAEEIESLQAALLRAVHEIERLQTPELELTHV